MHNKHRLINMPVLLNGPYNKDLCTLQSPSHNSLPSGKPGLHLPAYLC
jgi:hypothetical protein